MRTLKPQFSDLPQIIISLQKNQLSNQYLQTPGRVPIFPLDAEKRSKRGQD